MEWVWSEERLRVTFWFSVGYLDKVLGREFWEEMINLRVFA